MGCTGCNDGCFDESIQLQVGPQGPQGVAGADGAGENGADGVDGISILYQSTAINSPSTITNSYTDAISNISIPANTIGTVGDMLRFEILVQNDHQLDNAAIGADVSFSMKITFDGDTVFDNVVGYSNFNANIYTGAKIILDLVVSATDTLKPRTIEFLRGWGSRSTQVFVANNSSTEIGYVAINTLSSGGSEISNITPTLSADNLVDIQLKNSDGAATSIASVTSVTLYKYLKS